MASRIRDLLIFFLPSEWGRAGIGTGADSPGPPGAPPPPAPPGPAGGFRDFDILELRMMAQLLLAQLGGPVTLGEMEPRSIEDLNVLEARLAAASQELKSLRADLENR